MNNSVYRGTRGFAGAFVPDAERRAPPVVGVAAGAVAAGSSRFRTARTISVRSTPGL